MSGSLESPTLRESPVSGGTSPNAASSSAPASISLAAVVDQAGILFDRTDESKADNLRQARSLLQSWATIKGLLGATSAEHLYERAQELRGASNTARNQTHGQYIWTRFEQWWWDSCEMIFSSSTATDGYKLGAPLLYTVERLYEISPLPRDIDPFNANSGAATYFPPNYSSQLEVSGWKDSPEPTLPTVNDRAEDRGNLMQALDHHFRTGSPGKYVRYSRPWLSEDRRTNEPQENKDGEGKLEDTESDTESIVDSYELQWRSIISILYLTNLNAMQIIQPLLETEVKGNFAHAIDRFRVWGCSLFTPPLSLDTVLQSSQDSIQNLRVHVIGTLGDIALITVRLLCSLPKRHEKITRKAILQLQACFGRFEEMNKAVLEIPDSFYNDARQENELTLAAILEKQIAALIDCLFNVTPAISRIRQAYLLDLEQEQKKPKSVQDTLSTPLASGVRDIYNGPALEPSVYPSVYPPYIPYPALDPSVYPPYIPYPVYEVGGYQEKTSGPSNHGLQTMSVLGGGQPALSPPYKQHDPMLEMLAMDLELAEAIKASLASHPGSEKAQSSEDRATMAHIMKWEKEISRLKDWSEAFEKSLGASPTAAEMDARLDAFQRLVNIGCVFASAIPKHVDPKSTFADRSSAEEKIKRMVAAMPNGWSMDVKIDLFGKSPLDALNALSQANAALSDQ